MQPLVVVRPQAIRIASAATLALIIAWAALSAGPAGEGVSNIGVLAYPAIIALQTTREWGWRLEVGPRGLRERQGVGGTREIPWTSVTGIVMPDAAWWRINPVLQVEGAPNVQLTAAEGIEEVIAAARRKRKDLVGSVESVSLVRSLTPWLVLLGLASLMVGAQLAGTA